MYSTLGVGLSSPFLSKPAIKPDGKARQLLTSLFSSTIKMEIMRFMLVTKPQRAKRSMISGTLSRRGDSGKQSLYTEPSPKTEALGAFFQKRRESRP